MLVKLYNISVIFHFLFILNFPHMLCPVSPEKFFNANGLFFYLFINFFFVCESWYFFEIPMFQSNYNKVIELSS